VEGDTVREIKGDLFGQHSPTGPKHKMSAVKLLYPVQPTKILALAGNYLDGIGVPACVSAAGRAVAELVGPSVAR